MNGCVIKGSNIYPDTKGKKICSPCSMNRCSAWSNPAMTSLDDVALLEPCLQ